MTVIENTAADRADELDAVAGPQPCVARPHAGLEHRDGPCRCFVGGPAPVHAGRPEDAVLAMAFYGAALPGAASPDAAPRAAARDAAA